MAPAEKGFDCIESSTVVTLISYLWYESAYQSRVIRAWVCSKFGDRIASRCDRCEENERKEIKGGYAKGIIELT